MRIKVSLLVLGRDTKSPLLPFWALEMYSPEVACAKDAQSLWGHHSKVLLPLSPSQALLLLIAEILGHTDGE